MMQSGAHQQSLLMDSFSSDVEDVPDLELIPPTKVKKRKVRFKRPKFPTATAFSSSSHESNQYARSAVLPRTWSVCLAFVLLSLVCGLVTVSWFTVSLYRQVRQMQSTTLLSAQSTLTTVAGVGSDEMAQLQRKLKLLSGKCDQLTESMTTLKLQFDTLDQTVSINSNSNIENVRQQTKIAFICSYIENATSQLVDKVSTQQLEVEDLATRLKTMNSSLQNILDNPSLFGAKPEDDSAEDVVTGISFTEEPMTSSKSIKLLEDLQTTATTSTNAGSSSTSTKHSVAARKGANRNSSRSPGPTRP